jgi:hypothetical protein
MAALAAIVALASIRRSMVSALLALSALRAEFGEL